MLNRLCKLLLLLTVAWYAGCTYAQSKLQKPFAERKDVKQFIQEMHQQYGIDKSTLTAIFKTYASNPKVIRLMDRQFEAMPWYRYRDRLLTEKRINDGVRFWRANATVLDKASKKFGVPPEIIVAILGIETSYGDITGTFPVVQSLATLAFDYPRRAAYFRKELEHFILLTEEGALHPTNTLGSYAGAMGMPQFMPSSYRKFAVDFSGTGKRDLIYDKVDVIGSVANYLKINGWKAGQPIAHKAMVTGNAYRKLPVTKGHQPTISLKELAKYNVRSLNAKKISDNSQKVKFMVLESAADRDQGWLGFHNFYVITRYNNSTLYAMAVTQLSEQLRARYKS